MSAPQPNALPLSRTSLALGFVVSLLCGALIAIPFRDYEGAGRSGSSSRRCIALVAAQRKHQARHPVRFGLSR